MSNSLDIKIYTPQDKLSAADLDDVVGFLFQHLDQYGDARKDIKNAIDYAMQEIDSPGGYVLSGLVDGNIAGAVVVNRTGMSGYIPENILVYIAVDRGYRGQGIGKQLMKAAIEQAEGDIALHVEPDNPARFLYEKLGFENKYLEMRLKKNISGDASAAGQKTSHSNTSA